MCDTVRRDTWGMVRRHVMYGTEPRHVRYGMERDACDTVRRDTRNGTELNTWETAWRHTREIWYRVRHVTWYGDKSRTCLHITYQTSLSQWLESVPLLRTEVVSHKLSTELYKICRYITRSSLRNVITDTSSLTALLAVRRVLHRTILSSAEQPAIRYSTGTASTSNFDHSRRKLRGMFALSANPVRNTNHVRMRTL
jgi:hypothetical protein